MSTLSITQVSYICNALDFAFWNKSMSCVNIGGALCTYWVVLFFCSVWSLVCRVILKCHCRMFKARHILIGELFKWMFWRIVPEMIKFWRLTLLSYTLIFYTNEKIGKIEDWLKFEKFSKKTLKHSEANSFLSFRLGDMGFVIFYSEFSCLHCYNQTIGYQATCKKVYGKM